MTIEKGLSYLIEQTAALNDSTHNYGLRQLVPVRYRMRETTIAVFVES
jgi:hypothetical protein